MLYYLTVALQAFCIFHVYKNHKPYHWYFVIFFIPGLGSLIYIITQVFSKSDADKIQDNITTIINPTKKVKDLEKKIEFSDTYTNRIDLAAAYAKSGNTLKAIENYNKTLEDKVQDEFYARQQLVLCYYEIQDYNNVIAQAEIIKNRSEFKGSKQQFCYGLALKENGRIEEAEEELKKIDKPYSNYQERLELAKFYIENNKQEDGKSLLEEISNEAQYMTKPNRRIYRSTITEVERTLKSL